MYRSSENAIDRIRQLEVKLARTPAKSTMHRNLTKAIGIAATAYRVALDGEQAAKHFDPKP